MRITRIPTNLKLCYNLCDFDNGRIQRIWKAIGGCFGYRIYTGKKHWKWGPRVIWRDNSNPLTLHGDGQTDDRDALQAWIDGKPVCWPNGKILDPLYLDAKGKEFAIMSGNIFTDGEDPDERVSDRVIANATFNLSALSMITTKSEYGKRWTSYRLFEDDSIAIDLK